MFDLRERVSYLKGLLDGLDISDGTKEGKAIKAVVEVLDEIVDAIMELTFVQEDLLDYVDCIDEDLAALEDTVYGERFVEIECPNCGELISIDLSVLEDDDTEIICPFCGDVFSTEDVIRQMCRSFRQHCEDLEEDWYFDEDWDVEEDEDDDDEEEE
ncbi:MAG TPA: hypothetical protein PLB36_02650 [Bacillota bacterium]|nr:hypothetical protein [Bacillota bacterium]HOK64485.1 hypothetical protein [Bacillota bacterium]HOL11771.1 hypothetical protein [Bacillota bacterium]HOQ02315.1 hypothetical protein [Bacillota bacterium]HPP60820.1 hypothetical protein [Bacillota bacterium]